MPRASAAACAAGMPSRRSWAVRATAERPASAASAGIRSGASEPSETVEWVWRSITEKPRRHGSLGYVPDLPGGPAAPDHDPDDDKPKEACGVFGVYAPRMPVAHLTYDGLYALQHRGQESAGMAVSDGDLITVDKDMGLVTNVFNDYKLAALPGHLAIGHTRYSTTGSSCYSAAQPVHRSAGRSDSPSSFALAHNRNLTNTQALADEAGMLPGMIASDSELIAELVARAYPNTPRSDERELEIALLEVLPRLEGAYSLTLMDEAHLVGVRDPNGFRPLCLGRLDS